MNSLKEFAALRPSVEPLDASTADRVWARATGSSPVHVRSDEHADDEPSTQWAPRTGDDRRAIRPARRRQWTMAAAAALVVVGVGAVILVGGANPSRESAPAGEQPPGGLAAPDSTALADRVPEPPLLQIDGWAMTSFSDEMGAGNGAGTPSSILAPTDSLDRWIRFTEVPGDFPTTTVPFDAATDSYLLLAANDGTLVAAESWGLDGATFQRLATEALSTGVAPAGYEYLSARDAAQWNRLVFYEFSTDVPTHHLGVVLAPGGGSQLPDGANSTPDFRIAWQPDNGARLATSVDGFWGVSVTAEGFESDGEVLGVLDSLVEVDRARFDEAVAALPSRAPDSTMPGGRVVSPKCTTPGCDEPPSPRSALDLPGWTVTAADTGDGVIVGAEYLYASADGRQLQVNFYPSSLQERVAGEFAGDAVVVLGDTSQVAAYPEGRRFRFDAELGANASLAGAAGWDGWLIEIDGQPFDSLDAFMAIVDEIVITS